MTESMISISKRGLKALAKYYYQDTAEYVMYLKKRIESPNLTAHHQNKHKRRYLKKRIESSSLCGSTRCSRRGYLKKRIESARSSSASSIPHSASCISKRGLKAVDRHGAPVSSLLDYVSQKED